MRTHYDNLKVSRSAPPEVISAAYRSLSKLYHPDTNNGNREAARIMAIVNKSYEVLGDPERRRQHDLWIARKEQGKSGHEPRGRAEEQPKALPKTPRKFLPYWLVALAIVILGIVLLGHNQQPEASGLPPYQAVASTILPAVYVRPSKADNGQPWPVSAGYIDGYPRLRSKGRSRVTIDNKRSGFDAFVKLVSISHSHSTPVRMIYIPAGQSFEMDNISSGKYDIRFRNLSNGGLLRVDTFNLSQSEVETKTDDGSEIHRKATSYEITLYPVIGGHAASYPLREDEF